MSRRHLMYKHRGRKRREENVYNHTFQLRFQAKERFFQLKFLLWGLHCYVHGCLCPSHIYLSSKCDVLTKINLLILALGFSHCLLEVRGDSPIQHPQDTFVLTHVIRHGNMGTDGSRHILNFPTLLHVQIKNPDDSQDESGCDGALLKVFQPPLLLSVDFFTPTYL